MLYWCITWNPSGRPAILHVMSVTVSGCNPTISLRSCGDAKAPWTASESCFSSRDRQLSTRGAHCFESARASHWIRPGCLCTWEEAMGAEGHRSRVALSTASLHHRNIRCMLYWWAMGKIRKAVSLLITVGGGPIPRSMGRMRWHVSYRCIGCNTEQARS